MEILANILWVLGNFSKDWKEWSERGRMLWMNRDNGPDMTECMTECKSDIRKQDRYPGTKMIIQGRNLANWNQEQTHKQKYNY